MENLMSNDGRLSAVFERKVAAIARSLIDQYAANFIKDSKRGQDYDDVPKYVPQQREEQQMGLPREDDSGTALQADSAEAAKARRKAKLSAAMKGRPSFTGR
jgi:hypothetical protein